MFEYFICKSLTKMPVRPLSCFLALLWVFFALFSAVAPDKALAALPRPAALLDLRWQLYSPAAAADFQRLTGDADGKTSVPGQSAPPEAGTAESATGNPASGQEELLLLLTAVPPKGSYLYAPFSPGQTSEETTRLTELVRPLAITFSGPGGSALPVKVFYPPGSRKFDQYSEMELPVYEGETTIALLVPVRALHNAKGGEGQLSSEPAQGGAAPTGGADLGQPYASLNLSGLLCSSSACAPLRQTITLDGAPPVSEALPPSLREQFKHYRQIFAEPADNGKNMTGQANPDSGQEKGNQPPAARRGSLQDASAATDAGRNLLAPYTGCFAPVYFQQGLEVSGLGRAALFGFLAGLILNFMPCVLPVISLKLGMLAGLGGLQGMRGDGEIARRSRARFRTYSMFFSLGVLVWFAALFAVIGFAGMMWGQFFQSRTLLLSMAIILFLLALSLFGVFRLPLLHVSSEPGSQAGSAAGGSPSRKGSLKQQAFAGGLLATLLATPCSGPLLGGVLGWAVGQPLFFLAVTLLCVALGMASPFILLSVNPGLARFLPRPGGWTLILEKLLGFLLLGTVLYLLSMLPGERLFIYLGAFILLALAAWLWGRRSPQARQDERMDSLQRTGRAGSVVKNRKSLATALTSAGIAFLALYLAFAWQPAGKNGPQWREFTSESFEELLGRENLLLDFTADWCINCRALEATTLSPGNMAKWADEHNLTYIKVDITANNPAGEELLSALGSASIPLLAVFPAGEKHANPTVLRDLISGSQLEKALTESLGGVSN